MLLRPYDEAYYPVGWHTEIGAMRASNEWHGAASLLQLGSEKRGEGWPSSLNIEWIAALESSGELERLETIRGMLREDIDAKRVQICGYASFVRAQWLPWRSIRGMTPPRSVTLKDVPYLDRKAYEAWLKLRKLEPGEYLRDWLGPPWNNNDPAGPDEGKGARIKKKHEYWKRTAERVASRLKRWSWAELARRTRKALVEDSEYQTRFAIPDSRLSGKGQTDGYSENHLRAVLSKIDSLKKLYSSSGP